MTRADKILLAGLLFIALACAGALYGRVLLPGRTQGARAVATVGGKVVRAVELPGNGSFVLPGHSGPATVEVAGKRIRMQQARCPGGHCLRQGWIEHPGESIVCVPGQIVIRIEGAAVLDAVTR